MAAFRRAVESAIPAAREGRLVTFGVVPTNAETGYGYIRAAPGDGPVRPVAEFVEKPDAARAAEFVASGSYFWNSGMFLFSASAYLDELARHDVTMLAACRRAHDAAVRDLDFIRLDRAAFESCRADSIDYAVMEKTERAAVVALDAGWSDVGSWASLQDALPADAAGNVTRGDVVTEDSKDCLLYSTERLVATVGLEGHVVIETKDAVMVAPQGPRAGRQAPGRADEAGGRSEPGLHREVFRPWGSYDSVDAGARFQVKRLTIKPGATLSLQMHRHRAEHWVVVKGTARITRGEEVFLLRRTNRPTSRSARCIASRTPAPSRCRSSRCSPAAISARTTSCGSTTTTAARGARTEPAQSPDSGFRADLTIVRGGS